MSIYLPTVPSINSNRFENKSTAIFALDLHGIFCNTGETRTDPLPYLDLPKTISLITEDRMCETISSSLLYRKLKIFKEVGFEDKDLLIANLKLVNIPLSAKAVHLIREFWGGTAVKDVIARGNPLHRSEPCDEMGDRPLLEKRIYEFILAAGYFNEREILDSENTVEVIRDIISPDAPLSHSKGWWKLHNPVLDSEERRNSLKTLLSLLYWIQANVNLYFRLKSDEDAVNLQKFLTNSTVFSLKISGLVNQKRVSTLTTLLENSQTLAILDLSSDYPGPTNSIGSTGAIALARVIEGSKSLRLLDLSQNSIGVEGAIALAQAIKVNKFLRELELWYNCIGDAGANAFAKAIKKNQILTVLHLPRNCIGADGAIALAGAIMENQTLQRLELWYNKIEDKGAIALARATGYSKSLTKLNLWLCGIGDKGAEAFAEAIKKNQTLKELNLSWNLIGPMGAKALARAIEVNKSLRELDLSKNDIGDEGGIAFGKMIEKNQTLEVLHLHCNSIGSKGTIALEKAFKQNKTLSVLSIEN